MGHLVCPPRAHVAAGSRGDEGIRHRVVYPALMTPSVSETVFAEWLGVDAGDDGAAVVLTEHSVIAFKLGFKAGIVDVVDVYKDDTVLDESEMQAAVDLWKTYYRDSIVAAKATARASDELKLTRWLRARFCDRTVAASKEKPSKEVPTQALEDMAAQGATALWQLGYVELALALCRPPAAAETEGYSYKAPWETCMEGGRRAMKFKVQNLDDLIKAAMLDGQLAAIDLHFSTLCTALQEESDDPFAQKLAGLILGFWQETRTGLSSDDMVIWYLKEYRRTKRGRGLCCKVDEKLMRRAMGAKLSGTLNVGGADGGAGAMQLSKMGSVAASSTGGSDTASMVSSSLGSSVSAHQQAGRFEGQMSEVLSAVSRIASDVGGLSASVGSVKASMDGLASRLSAVESRCWPADEGGPSCSKCGSKTHLRRDCPQRNKTEREVDAAAAAGGAKKDPP